MLRASGFSTQAAAIPFILAKTAIPFIGLSSGSVAANGAITGITALPIAYASAYCWFPANILATTKAAGWYYCTFSTTTAGIAYLDSYTSGAPSIPASPTAVTDGKGAFTGGTAEEFGPTIALPANAMGLNGELRIRSTWRAAPNNANAKTGQIRWSGNSGSVLIQPSLASLGHSTQYESIQNRGAANVQVDSTYQVLSTNLLTTVQVNAFAVDSSQATTIVFSLTRATNTDNIVLESYLIELLSDGT